MKSLVNMAAFTLMAVILIPGCTKSTESKPAAESTIPAVSPTAEAAHSHGTGASGGVVFDLGSKHAELTVDHHKQQVAILFLGEDGKTPEPIAATSFVLSINETKTADGKAVPAMVLDMQPTGATDGKAAKFVGVDPGIGNVADFAGTVSGEIEGKPAMGQFDEAAVVGEHGHAHTPHDGVVAILKGAAGEEAGFVELKLHDDKGDLEAWLAKDEGISQPLDIPADSTITVTFKDRPGKTATLAARNKDQNEDEDGKANMRNGSTNYFIFPGDSGQDPTWLMGADFESEVQVSLTADGKQYTSEAFILRPHTHADGYAH